MYVTGFRDVLDDRFKLGALCMSLVIESGQQSIDFFPRTEWPQCLCVRERRSQQRRLSKRNWGGRPGECGVPGLKKGEGQSQVLLGVHPLGD